MAQLGKSIDLYLMDGTATGRWQATLSNWNCYAYKIPRADLKGCDDKRFIGAVARMNRLLQT